MILDRLTLYNFCLYRDEQSSDLTPGKRNGKATPIVLFGGINGGGKTTLLDAVQLALYVPRAQCSNRARLRYEDYLRECIHHGVEPAQGASVSLAFRFATEGEEHSYEVCRHWSVREGKLRENLTVSRDGERDRWLSGNWNQLVEELIPLGISQLFFFDAEKIRFLAEDESCGEELGAAIKSLLGLDLAERLIADASVLEARLSKELSSPEIRDSIEEHEGAIADCDADIRRLKEEIAALENDRLRARNRLQQAEDKFASGGGKYWEKRESSRQQLQQLGHRRAEIEAALAVLAGGELPLALVRDLLERVQEQDVEERQAAESRIVLKLLEKRDRRILATLGKEKIAKQTLDLLRKVQNRDRRERRNGSVSASSRLALSENAQSLLEQILKRGLDERGENAKELLSQLAETVGHHDSLERSLAAVPNDDVVRELTGELTDAAKEVAVVDEQIRRIQTKIDTLNGTRNVNAAALQKLSRTSVDEEIANEEAVRLAGLTRRTQKTMREFLNRATEAKIDRLSVLVTESFRFLLRKKSFIQNIHIDPATFAITLYDSSGHSIPKHRLSEGEKQIFAVSVLWGLARASRRPLPAIIDTPMGRLDKKHRQHLVQRYFPNASHQVIVLSTDTEIDRQYYADLQPHIARAFHLNYSEKKKLTAGEEGYFWATEETATVY